MESYSEHIPVGNNIVLFFLFDSNIFYSFALLMFGRNAPCDGSVEKTTRNHLCADPFHPQNPQKIVLGVSLDTSRYFCAFYETKLTFCHPTPPTAPLSTTLTTVK